MRLINTKVSFIGESKENTIITYNDHFDKINLGRNSTFHTSTLLVEGNDFIAKNLTINKRKLLTYSCIITSFRKSRITIRLSRPFKLNK